MFQRCCDHLEIPAIKVWLPWLNLRVHLNIDLVLFCKIDPHPLLSSLSYWTLAKQRSVQGIHYVAGLTSFQTGKDRGASKCVRTSVVPDTVQFRRCAAGLPAGGKTVELVASFRGLKSRVTFHAMLWIAHLQKIAPLLTRGNVALSPITSLTSLGTAPWRAAFYYHNIRSPSRRTCDTYWVVEYRWSVLPNQNLILFHPTSHCLFPVLGLQKQSGWCGLRLRGTI